MTYKMSIDNEMGGRDVCEAESLSEAVGIATEWAKDGMWKEGGNVNVRVWIGDDADPDEEKEFSVAVKADGTISEIPS